MTWTAAGILLFVLVVDPASRICPRTPRSITACAPILEAPAIATDPAYAALAPDGQELVYRPNLHAFTLAGSGGCAWIDGRVGRMSSVVVALSISEQRGLLAGIPTTVLFTYRDADGNLVPNGGPANLELGLEDAPTILDVTKARRARAGAPQ